MYQTKMREIDADWVRLEIPGVEMKTLFKDQTSGAMTVMTRMAAGSIIPAHWHSKADETVFVLEGDFVEDGESFGSGSYFVGKAETVHGPHSTRSGCVVLTHFSAELDFHLPTQS